jgi:uncharacterized protein YcbX
MNVLELWRFPVKSMLGEQLQQAEVGPAGLGGDRQRAVVDAGSGVSLSAKRYPVLLSCRAWTADAKVMIALPDGTELPADTAEVAQRLSALLNRRVTVQSANAGHTVRHEFPADSTAGEGEPFLWEPGLAAFVDSSPLHLITTGTLRELSRLQPDSDFSHARFRPNVLVETNETGFVEHNWVGHDLSLGPVKCRVSDHKARCVMTTHAQGDLPQDRDVIKTIVKFNSANTGIELAALAPGTVRVGDAVKLRA